MMKKIFVVMTLLLSGFVIAQSNVAKETIIAMANAIGLKLTESEKNNPTKILQIMNDIGVIEPRTFERMSVGLAGNSLNRGVLCIFLTDVIRGTNDKGTVISVSQASSFLENAGIPIDCTSNQPLDGEGVGTVFSSLSLSSAIATYHLRASRLR
jgi:hypothetical protein